MQVEISHGNIVSFTKNLVYQFEPLAAVKKIELAFETETQVWKTYFDKVKWTKIVSNIVSNAIKFTADNGRVNIHLKNVLKDKKDAIQLTVKDNGQGISAEYLPKIFDRFYLVELGLADYEINTNGKAAQHTSTHPQQENKLELLIIEDNAEMRSFIRSCVDENTYTVSEAADGEAGIQKALETVPDLIISDVMMPKMDGFGVVQAVRENLATSHIPLILLTAKAST